MKLTTPAYSALTDAQLLQKLIGVRAARKLYRGSLSPLFAATRGKDIPPEKCIVARELVKRWLGEELHRKTVLTQPKAVRNYLQIHFANQEHESFVALYLDALNRLIVAEELFRGSLTEAVVYPREIVKSALKHNADAVIFSHNHPSGVAKPSPQDKSITKILKQSLAVVEIRVLDHFIVAPCSTYSFAERGHL